jgi:hypothetical protein
MHLAAFFSKAKLISLLQRCSPRVPNGKTPAVARFGALVVGAMFLHARILELSSLSSDR